MDSAPRLVVINAWAGALFICAQASLFGVVLALLGRANDTAFNAARYAGQLDGELRQCVNAARNIRDLHVDCSERLERAKDRVAEALDRCVP